MKLYLTLIGRSLVKEINQVIDLWWKGMWFGMGLFSSVGMASWIWKLFD